MKFLTILRKSSNSFKKIMHISFNIYFVSLIIFLKNQLVIQEDYNASIYLHLHFNFNKLCNIFFFFFFFAILFGVSKYFWKAFRVLIKEFKKAKTSILRDFSFTFKGDKMFSFPAGIYMFNINNGNIRTHCSGFHGRL